MEYRLTITLDKHGHDESAGERVLEGFMATHPRTGPVADQNLAKGRLSVTFSLDAESAQDAFELGTSVFADGMAASGLAGAEIVRIEIVAAETEGRELLPA